MRHWLLVLWIALASVLLLPMDLRAQGPSVLDSPATQVAAGYVHTCAINATGGVECWGDNIAGQLGDGSTVDRATPVAVVDLEDDVAAIATGGSHTCALTMTGGVKCWGANISGQLGDGGGADSTIPVPVVGLPDGVAAITAGTYHTCALTIEGGVKCWGANNHGQLGSGETQGATTPVDVIGLASGIAAISAGHHHTCALTMQGGIKCWGGNVDGQVGNGSTVYAVATPADVEGFDAGAVGIAAGGAHTCAVTVIGGVLCWGRNMSGQLGNGNMTGSPIPVAVLQLVGVSAVAAGGDHSCVSLEAGGARCWGRNFGGELGDGGYENSSIPVVVAALGTRVAAVAAGNAHTCALTFAGGVDCWGINSNGQLGNDSDELSPMPVAVAGSASGVEAMATGSLHTCGLTKAGGVKCWGNNEFGQLGNGSDGDNAMPVPVMGFASGTTAVATGLGHTCLLTSAGRVKCSGHNYYGQLGDGSFKNNLVPVDVMALADVTAISAGFSHSCALRSTGSVRCWGANLEGQLGNGSTGFGSGAPVAVIGLPNGAAAIAAGGMHTCALATDGGVMCWGRNDDGQLGNGSTDDSSTPAPVAGLAGGVAIAAGARHTCALTLAGGVKCWGDNADGQLGDGGTTHSFIPVNVVGLAGGMVAIATGHTHTCALAATGEVKCWGGNHGGQLGIGVATEGPELTPMNVVGLGGIVAIAAGYAHTCALTSENGLKCWGANLVGELGDGTMTRRVVPSDILAAQSISFSLPASLPVDGSAALAATAESGGAVSFDTWTPHACTIDDGVLSVTRVGLCGVRATQVGGTRPEGGSDAAAPRQLRLVHVGGDRLFRSGFERLGP